MTQHKDGWHSFVTLCLTAKTPSELSKILDILLTPEEKTDIAMRCLIVKELLLQEKTQREIAKHLNVSIAKITRGSNELKRQNTKLLNDLKKQLT